MWRSVAEYVRSLDLDAWLVGGAVRDELLGRPHDEDFVVPGIGHDELRSALAAHGRVEDLAVAGQRVGVRLYPHDRAARALQPGGIEFTPPRRERSTGPGRHEFEIVADPDLPLEEDMRRRDFTINAMARRLATDELLDPLGGQEDLERRVLRTTGPTSFRDDPLRIVRGLRFVAQLDLDPDEDTLAQMREWAPQVRLVSGERIGGGLAADGMGELSKLVLGAHPAKALRLARDTGVLTQVIPEFEPALGRERGGSRLPLDEHHFSAVQAAADAGSPLEVRLALLLHDLAEATGGDDAVGGRIAAAVLERLRYPVRLRGRVRRLVERHSFEIPDLDDRAEARRFLARHGEELASGLLELKAAGLAARHAEVTPRIRAELERLEAFRATLEAERDSPHRLRDLALDGDDLIALGYRPGPRLGRTLRALLADVVEDPGRNTREWLSERARELA